MDLQADRWNAVRGRDRESDFIFCVLTTGIACRPGCPSRTPRIENVRFFDDFDSARAAGFRACKRCAPDDVAANADRQRLIEQACALIDADATIRLDDIAASVGVSRFHFQRIFREILGITPGDYRRAKREERLRRGLGRGQSVTEAIQNAGYGSSSRAYQADALGMVPSAYRAGGRGERVSYAIADSSLGRVLVARSERGICAIELGDDDSSVISALRQDLPHAELIDDETALADHLQAVLGVVDGDESASCLDLDIRGTAFQRRVWKALSAISAGQRRSYSEVADAIGLTGSARAVAATCARNPLAVAVPCHRVVGADGALKGYRWGISRKEALLRREALEGVD